ncbi:hypothetical protein E3T61_04220 [Cryobacterium lactosi]|uniref:Heparinase II/III-like C-terminal domain-containing protein n=2 Tax=Cryobacterium lactosi TaxID=1259202 RepID=A0A4R9BXV1_9MICO|nr:hypothetical protein E3T61_04220 [Cryobacterium lactosi]
MADGVDAVTLADILTRADRDLAMDWPTPLASSAARVHRDGNRDVWEAAAFARQHRLSRAAVAAAVTLDERWIDEVADGIVLLCEQSSWCWPAHDDSKRAHGAILATVTDPYLDLGAGEVVGQLAWIDQLLADQLDARYPGLRARMRHEASTRVLAPFVNRRDWHWLGLDGDVHNWSPWIQGNVLVAALRFLDAPTERAERAKVVELVIEGIDRYVAALPADGAIDEGYSYWWNGACRALEALDVLTYATGGRLDAAALIPALRETVAFPHRMHLGGAWYVNHADGQARPSADQPWHSLFRAAQRVGDPAALAHAASHRVAGRPVASEAEGLGRLLRGLTDPAWIAAGEADLPVTPPLPAAVWLASVEVLVAREHGGSSAGLTVAAKGGSNDEHHNHNDVGSFLVAADGVPVIVDAGRPTYTLATFGPDRYSTWAMQSTWHNVPEVRGVPQPAGRQYAAAAVVADLTADRSALSVDLTAAYPAPGLVSWRRTVQLDRGAALVTIADSWTLEPWEHGSALRTAEPPTSVRLLLAGDVVLDDGTALIFPLEGGPPVRLRWPAQIPAILTMRPLDDPMLSDVWGKSLTRLDLDVTGRDTISVTVARDLPTTGDER